MNNEIKRYIIVETILDDEQTLVWTNSYKTIRQAIYDVNDYLFELFHSEYHCDSNESQFGLIEWYQEGSINYPCHIWNFTEANRIFQISAIIV